MGCGMNNGTRLWRRPGETQTLSVLFSSTGQLCSMRGAVDTRTSCFALSLPSLLLAKKRTPAGHWQRYHTKIHIIMMNRIN